MKIQAKDCAQGGIFQMEPERGDQSATRITHVLTPNTFYFDNPNFRARFQSQRPVLFASLWLKRLRAQCEVKRGAAPREGLGPDAAAVARHDALHRRQANTGPGKVCRGMQALKSAKVFF